MRSRLAKLERRPRRCICDPISGVQYAKCFERWTLVLSSKTSPDLRMARRWPLFGEWPSFELRWLGSWNLCRDLCRNPPIPAHVEGVCSVLLGYR